MWVECIKGAGADADVGGHHLGVCIEESIMGPWWRWMHGQGEAVGRGGQQGGCVVEGHGLMAMLWGTTLWGPEQDPSYGPRRAGGKQDRWQGPVKKGGVEGAIVNQEVEASACEVRSIADSTQRPSCRSCVKTEPVSMPSHPCHPSIHNPQPMQHRSILGPEALTHPKP